MPFANRLEAGRRLAAALQHLKGDQVVVLGLPRGGVPVALEVARALDAPLDVIVVRKLGVPFQPELAMGAIGEGGARVINTEIVRLAQVTPRELADEEARERIELERRAARFRGSRPRLSLAGRTAVIVDDGIATGSTARAACHVARAQGATRIVLAVPVAPQDWTDQLSEDADELISLETPRSFHAVGEFYADFSATTDDEVIECLERGAGRAAHSATKPTAGDRPPFDDEVVVTAGAIRLGGHLTVPDRAIGMVVFAHGSGSSRHSPRNQFVASVLNEAALGTLLFDLLTGAEEGDRSNVFDIGLLACRLGEATSWLRTHRAAVGLPIGYFGASTGAGAALWAAAEPGAEIAAVVSRGGRPDLAAERLAAVTAPTLLIVGGDDHQVLQLNRGALARLRCEADLVVIPGATHLFEEAGTLAAAAEAARDWFVTHLVPGK
ncbi:MAG: phosphoribosyltransferase family protein [Ilumatobacteraceae bacterium]